MARVTVEDCVDKVENRFETDPAGRYRARMISSGAPPQTVEPCDRDRTTVSTCAEVADDDDFAGRPA